jgi:hypothetical protein
MHLRSTLIAALGLCISSNTFAASADIALSEDTAKFSFSSFINGFQHGRTMFNGGYYYNTNEDHVIDLGLHVVDVVGTKTPGLQIGVGGQLYLADLANQDALALALGGNISFRPQQLKRINFVADGHYAPGIVSYMDADRFYEYSFRVEYSLLPQADVYVGYRKISMDSDIGKISTDDNGHVGLRISF